MDVAYLAETACRMDNLKELCYIAGLIHDLGKYKPEYQQYLLKSTIDPTSTQRGEVTHSTSGAYLITQKMDEHPNPFGKLIAELIRHAILSHHGLSDCITKEGKVYYEKRLQADSKHEDLIAEFYTENKMNILDEKLQTSFEKTENLIKEIIRFTKSGEKLQYGSRHFYFGYCERILLSCLIHGDRLDTMCFTQKKDLPVQYTSEELEQIWCDLQNSFDQFCLKKERASLLNECRGDISDQCFQAATKESTIYRLVVKTGAGKTLSSLRYALEHARKFKKRHIFYIAPFNSILEQNAEEIRKAVGNSDMVLEHHCNVVADDEEYLQLAETWDTFIIVTTAVQLFETLFSSRTASIRRFHALIDSVIIIDEVQAIPIRCIKLFNLAMNFLSNFAKTSIVLCSATLPLFDRLQEKSIQSPINLVDIKPKYKSAFERYSILDHSEIIPGGFSYEQAADYIVKHSIEAQNMLVIVNTKEAARELYSLVKAYYDKQINTDNIVFYHLSTSMCAANRREKLECLRKDLADKKKVICISTQIVEAGVDLSFHYVVRSLAGLDNIIQAAGRCNRSHEYGEGIVSIIQIRDENTKSLRDIVYSQEVLKSILATYRANPELYQGDLSSPRAIDEYYHHYFQKRQDEMEYYVSNPTTTLVEMLSENRKLTEQMEEEDKKSILLKQAFQTAGELFDVIPDEGKEDLVVCYNEESATLIQSIWNKEYYGSSHKQIDYKVARKLIRQLQPYTVSISKGLRVKLGNAIDTEKELGINILKKEYYDTDIGVNESPKLMEFIDF